MPPEELVEGEKPVDAPAEPAAAPVDIDAGIRDAIKAGVEDAGGKKAAVEEPESAPALGADSKPVAAVVPAKPADKPAAGAEPPPKGEKEHKADPVNDPIPEDVKGRTRERMEALITKVKESRTEVDTIRKDRDDLVGMVTDTKATPEQFNQSLDYLKAVNSGDAKQLERAIQIIENERTALYGMLGKPVPGVDLIAKHPDLQAEIERGDLSRERALEVATVREQRATAQARQQQAERTQQEQVQQTKAMEEGKAELNDLEKHLRKIDPQYEAKRKVVIGELQEKMATIPPPQWAREFMKSYSTAVVPAAAAAPAAGSPPAAAAHSSQQPLRGRQPAGGVSKKPGSLLEAMREGLAQVRR